jgi:hypothetical protein
MKVFLYEILIWKKKTMMSAWNRDYKSILLIKNDKIEFFLKKIKGQKMHQTKKIKNNRSNVMAWSIELVIWVMDLTEFNMFSHKSIVNLNILKNTKKSYKEASNVGLCLSPRPMPVKGKTKACRPLSSSPHAWACYFCSYLKGWITCRLPS